MISRIKGHHTSRSLRTVQFHECHQIPVLIQLSHAQIPHGQSLILANDDEPRIRRKANVSAGLQHIPSPIPAHRCRALPLKSALYFTFETVDNVVDLGVSTDHDQTAVVAELDFCPFGHHGWVAELFEVVVVEDGEHGERLFVEHSDIVEEYMGVVVRGDGEGDAGWIVGDLSGSIDVEAARTVGGSQVPEANGVVEGRGEEEIIQGRDFEIIDGLLVTFEISDEGVVMEGKVSYCVILLRTGIDTIRVVVSELGEVDAILLAEEFLGVFPQLAVVQLNGLIIAGSQQPLAGIVEVERCDHGALGRIPKRLCRTVGLDHVGEAFGGGLAGGIHCWVSLSRQLSGPDGVWRL